MEHIKIDFLDIVHSFGIEEYKDIFLKILFCGKYVHPMERIWGLCIFLLLFRFFQRKGITFLAIYSNLALLAFMEAVIP